MTQGVYWRDYASFGPDYSDKVKFIFGCDNKETDLIYEQEADGILGLSNRHHQKT
jgi:hypothetical protein